MKVLKKAGDISDEEVEQVKKKISQTIVSDEFLREKVDPAGLTVFLSKTHDITRSEISSSVQIDESGAAKRIIHLDIITLTMDIARYLLKHELYHIPSLENFARNHPRIALRFNEWRKKLNDDEFFTLLGAYHYTIIDIGIDCAVMVTNPDFADICYENESTLISNTLNKILRSHGDYIFHYVLGIPTIGWAAHFLANKIGESAKTLNLGEKLKTQWEETFYSTHPFVKQRLSNYVNSMIENNPFTEDHFPKIDGEFSYIQLAEKLFQDFCELKESLPYSSSPNILTLHNNPMYKKVERAFLRNLEKARKKYS